MEPRLSLVLLVAAVVGGCQFGVDIAVCRNGGQCPQGTTCDEELGVCREFGLPPPDAGSDDDDDDGGPKEGDPAEGEGEGEGEGELPAPVVTVCGDNSRQGREECDDGNRLSGDGCSSTCRVDRTVAEVEPNDLPDDTGAQTVGVSTVLTGGITTMVYDEVAQQSYSEMDSFWVSPSAPVVVRIESFDRADIDDCSGTQGMYASLYRQAPAAGGDDTFLRGAWDNGNGRCMVLTTAMSAQPHSVTVSEGTWTALIPTYRVQVTTLDDRGPEEEPNGDLAHADGSARDGLDAFTSGLLASADDIDVFAVDVPPGRGLRAEVIPDTESTPCDAFNARITLLDGDGIERAARIAEFDICPYIDGTGDAPRNPEALNLTFAPRTLYVAVSKGDAAMVGSLPYRVAFTVR